MDNHCHSDTHSPYFYIFQIFQFHYSSGVLPKYIQQAWFRIAAAVELIHVNIKVNFILVVAWENKSCYSIQNVAITRKGHIVWKDGCKQLYANNLVPSTRENKHFRITKFSIEFWLHGGLGWKTCLNIDKEVYTPDVSMGKQNLCQELLCFMDLRIPNPDDSSHFLSPSNTQKYNEEKICHSMYWHHTFQIQSLTHRKWELLHLPRL